MTVAAFASSITYSEDGIATSFAAPFRYNDPSDLVVTRIAADQTSTDLVYNIGYTATDGSTDAGGEVIPTLVSKGTRLKIKRLTPRAQDAVYTTGDRFPAATTENAFDLAMLIAQELDDTAADIGSRAVLVPEGGSPPSLPSKEDLIGSILMGDADGNLIPAPVEIDAGQSAALAVARALLPQGTVTVANLAAALDAAGLLSSVLDNLPPDQVGGFTQAATRIWKTGGTSSPFDAFAGFLRAAPIALNDSQITQIYAAAGIAASNPVPLPFAVADGKVDIVPATPFSPIVQGYATGLAAFLNAWWLPTPNYRFVYTNGGGIAFAQASTTEHSTWIMIGAFNGALYEPWRMATDAGNVTSAAAFGAMIEHQWANWKSLYTDNDFETGGSGMVNTMDDGVVLAEWMTQIGDYFSTAYGTANAEYLRACRYLNELIPSLTARFRSTIRAQDFNYGVASPVLNTVFKSGKYGMLYAAEGSGAGGIGFYGYGSSPLEMGLAVAALWLAQQTPTSNAWKAALLQYAINTEAWIAAVGLTPAPTPVGEGQNARSVQGIAFAMVNLDPNVNANNDPTINGGAAQRGSYDVNQVYLAGQNAYFARPVRDLTAGWEAATQSYAVGCARLYVGTGSILYRNKAQATFDAYVDINGFGGQAQLTGEWRLRICRDPHSISYYLPAMTRAGIALGILTPTHRFTQALFNTARKAIVSSVNGAMGINWQGPEYNPLEKTWTWEESRGIQGLGGQAQRNYMMMGGHNLALVGATQLFPQSTELAIGSGILGEIAYAQIPSMLGAVIDALQEVMTKEGGQFVGRVMVGDQFFYLDMNNVGSPFINFANGKTFGYDRINLKVTYGGLGVNQWSVTDTGVQTSRGASIQNGNP